MKIRINPRVLSFIGSLFMRLIGATWRIRWEGLDNYDRARKLSGNIIFVSWHGRLLVLSYTHRKRDIQVLASEHYDGDLMGKTIERLGFGHLKGSSRRGGARALRELSGVLKKGMDVGLTVDGPKGPRGVLQQGAVELARMTGKAVLPVTNTASRRFILGSWDRFQIPLPFSKVVVAYGEPFTVDSSAGQLERDRIRADVGETLNSMTSILDIKSGHRDQKVWPHEDF